MIKLSPDKIFEEYQKGQIYKSNLDLFETVKRNENFYIGKQWEGVNAPNLPKPVLNILKRVVSYFISMIVSDDVSTSVNLITGETDDLQQQIFKALSNEFDGIIENNHIKSLNRQLLKNCAVDGDCCLHCYFDTSVKTQNITDGAVNTEILLNTDVYFGNEQIENVQKQPYIIISYRKLLDNLKEKYPKENIQADDAENEMQDKGEGKVTVLRKYYKQNNTVYYTEVCKNCVLTKPTNTGYKLYPLAWMSWDKVKNSYHGQSPMTPVIQNQIDINRLFAMCLKQVRDGAFPKVVYSKALLPDGWDNTVGAAIGVNGDVNQAVMRGTGVTEMSSQVISMINLLVDYTKETMGASDAALGNVKADNTSAIIALQKSSAMPLELQRLDFYQFVEDYIRIFFDIITTNYGTRKIKIENELGQTQYVPYNFTALHDLQLKINVDVGAGSYWSELAGISTLDNLYQRGIMTDAVTYLDSLPNGVIPNKEKILQKVKEKQQEAEQLQALQQGGMTNAMQSM